MRILTKEELQPANWWWGPPAIENLKRFHDKRGMALVVVILLLLPATLLSALFMDMGRLYAVRVRMQLTADATALAAVSGLIDGDVKGDSVWARARYYLARNTIHSEPALLESLNINTDAGTVSLVLKHQTGSLLLAPGGLTIRMGAKATVQLVQSENELGRPIPNGNAFGWWKQDHKNPGAKDSGVVKLSG
ncbi:MAG TPA: pilus assembly protein TadG-related protein [Gemmatimonadales bacterium]|nr:pilus assembly protein TadG-related protein [Gemmatimonadales bacterium]